MVTYLIQETWPGVNGNLLDVVGGVNRSKVGYNPPGSRLCSVHGGAKSEPRVWSNLKPYLGTPLT